MPNLPGDVDSWGRSACYPRSSFYLLISGPSTRDRWVTMACFHICLADKPRSQAPLYHCALRTIANRAEGAFALLRYFLGGDRPSQTAQLTLFCGRLHGTQLGFRHNKSGISLVAPPRPKAGLQSLPPMLRMPGQNPILACSKASRGLSVLVRERRIFTTTSTSPDPSGRQ